MPTNLPPDYFQVEKRFREAESVEEKIELLKEMMSIVPKHKGTDHLRADLRRRLAKLNDEAQSQKSTSKHESAFRVPKAGAGQVVIIGPARTGKSALHLAITNPTRVNPFETRPTFEPVPAMMPFENIQVQVVDTPPISRDYAEPRLKDLIRKADLVLIVVDLHQDPIQQLKETTELLEDSRIVATHRKGHYLDNIPLSDLPFIIAVNKCDNAEARELYSIFYELMDEDWACIPVSAFTAYNLEQLKEEIYILLNIIRVYTKVPGKEPDFETPFVMQKGQTVEDLAGRIHNDILKNMKSARVWGKAVYDGQLVHKNYILQEGDVVEIHT